MPEFDQTKTSKYLAYVLRHNPTAANIELDENGWADVLVLLKNSKYAITLEQLCKIVDNDSKGRFSFNEDKTKIRANQGHSVNVNPDLAPMPPPDVLFHGTSETNAKSICESGILPMSRIFVHLSKDVATAHNVGRRHGKPVVFAVDCRKMADDGNAFFLSQNGVWQTRFVPSKYLTLLQPQADTLALRIWLDDVRPAPTGYVHCRSVNSAKRLIEENEKFCEIAVIDCDHDLGEFAPDGGDGIKLLDWLVERQTFYPIELHTMNPVGRENMQREVNRYWKK